MQSNTTIDIRLCGNIPRNELCLSRLNNTNGNPTLRKTPMEALQNVLPLELLIPKWAVPAKGESKLEPVCESVGRQAAIDLTSQKAFRVGRSPSCDIQLMHATSSRRHAIVFHHSNGSCYVVDCGSGHGTFVNGKRIAPPTITGVVVPHKIRRGSLVRFGGPGAPCFVLKSFVAPTDKNNTVLYNTRLNALGVAKPLSRKRSLEDLQDFDCKRVRCSSPPLSPEQPIRLVSPDPPFSKPRRVTFSMDPPALF